MRLVFVVLVLGGSGCNAVRACMGIPRSAQDESLSMWSMDQVQSELGQAALFDANPRELYDEHHLPGARWVPYDGVTAEVLPEDKAQALVFYCANPRCSASHVAARSALELGHTSVHVMPDGIFGWVEAGRPTEP